MCGIAGFHLKRGAKIDSVTLERFADLLLEEIDHRGGDACGIGALSDDGTLSIQRASCVARAFIAERRSLPRGVRTVLLHTRFATQGNEAFPENNHPVSTGAIHCTHNGHVTNDWELIKESGIERIGRVDSEAIPATVSLRGWENVGRAMEEVEGAAAVALLNSDTGALALARGYSSPLVVVETSSLVAWASTREALVEAWRGAIGTPPHASRFEYVKEGTLLRWERDGSSSRETFAAHAPVYVTRYFDSRSGKWTERSASTWQDSASDWDDDTPRLGAEDEARLKRLGLTTGRERVCLEDEDETLALSLGLEECTCCGDYFAPEELERVPYDDWTVCSGCARWFGDAFQREDDDALGRPFGDDEDDDERARAARLVVPMREDGTPAGW